MKKLPPPIPRKPLRGDYEALALDRAQYLYVAGHLTIEQLERRVKRILAGEYVG